MKLVNLEKERAKKGWTQEEISSRLGVARSTYANWESGKREADLENVEKLADMFEVSVDYLMGRVAYASSKNANLIVKEPEVQFIMRAKEKMNPKAYAKFLKLMEDAQKAFDDEDD